MGSEAQQQTIVAKVPLELLFTDYITEEHKTHIPNFTEAWYEVHKRFANLPIVRLSPHLQLFRYLMNGGEYPKRYVEWHSLIYTTRGMQVPMTEHDLLAQRKLQYSILMASLARNPNHFLNDPILATYDKLKGYFRIKDGHHRAIFQYCKGIRHIPARMSIHDYQDWSHADAVHEVKMVFSRHQRELIYTPIHNPYFEHVTCARDQLYPTRLDLILEYLGSISVRGKSNRHRL